VTPCLFGGAIGTSVLLSWMVTLTGAAPLSFVDPPLRPYTVGARFDSQAAQSAGFVMTDAFQLDEGHGRQSFFRYEDETEDAMYFVEASVSGDLVHALGWSRTLPKAAADSVGAAWLGAFASRFGFPADIVTDGPTHAVAWINELASLRLELIEQPEEMGSDQWEISAVLRQQVKGDK
jgi:hypothetical protein